jgi:hypothetical protein
MDKKGLKEGKRAGYASSTYQRYRNNTFLKYAGCGVWDLSGDLVTRLAGGSGGEAQEVSIEIFYSSN